MNNEFVPYDIALAMKELGFDEPCFYVWNIDTKELFSSNSTDINGQPTNLDLMGNVSITAPLYQQAFRWFREKYNLWVEIAKPITWLLSITDKKQEKRILLEDYDNYVEPTSYEEAELACLRKLIEIVNQNKDDDNT